MSQDEAPAQGDALGAVGEKTAPDTEPQVRHEPCGSAPSVELFERGVGGMEIARLRIQAVQDVADNDARWAQVQEEYDQREPTRPTHLLMVLGGFLFGDGLGREKRKQKWILTPLFCADLPIPHLPAAMASSCFAEDSFNGAVFERWDITFNDAVAGCRSCRRPLAGVLGAAVNNLKGAVAACRSRMCPPFLCRRESEDQEVG